MDGVVAGSGVADVWAGASGDGFVVGRGAGSAAAQTGPAAAHSTAPAVSTINNAAVTVAVTRLRTRAGELMAVVTRVCRRRSGES